MNEYQHQAARTINMDLTEQQLVLHALHGLAAEVGEVHGIFQKVYQGHELNLGHLREEIGDALWFIMELCTAYEWSSEEIAQEKQQMLRDVRGEISDIAVSIAGKVVERELNPQDHRDFVDEFIRNVGEQP